MPNWGGAASGAASGAALGSFIPGIGTGIGAGVGGLIGLFKGKKKDDPGADDVGTADDPTSKLLTDHAATQRASADAMKSQGMDAMAPVLDYFKKLLGNDPSAIMEATKPERGRVMDQYDAARNSIANFAPRGGGSNAAVAGTYQQEAQSLGDITSTARREASAQAGQLGATMTGLGLTADQLASADLNTVINAALARKGLDVQQRGQNMAALGDLGQGLGSLLGTYLTREGGAWGGKGGGGGTGTVMYGGGESLFSAGVGKL